MEIEDRALPAPVAATVQQQDTAAEMLGLPGFRVLASAASDGELQVHVETTEDFVGCPSCAAVAVLHDRRLRLVRDLPAGGRPVLLCWSKRVCAAGTGRARDVGTSFDRSAQRVSQLVRS